jgi:hypothetical protein
LYTYFLTDVQKRFFLAPIHADNPQSQLKNPVSPVAARSRTELLAAERTANLHLSIIYLIFLIASALPIFEILPKFKILDYLPYLPNLQNLHLASLKHQMNPKRETDLAVVHS